MSPFKNPNRQRLANAEASRRYRARKKAERLASAAEAEGPELRGSIPDRVAAWVSELEVSQGRRAGQRFEVLPWQREFLEVALAPGVSEAGLSVARGNGKTALLAAVAAAAVAGPLVQTRGEVVVVAASIPQGRILFEHTAAFLSGRIAREPSRWAVSHHSGTLTDRETGARVRVVGSEPGRAHGLAPSLALLDEPSQWHPARAERMVAAVRTALGKLPGARMVALGTRPAEAAHWFARLLDSPGAGQVAKVWAADAEAEPGDSAAWEAANPSLPAFPDLREAIAREASRAALDPAELASFRALRLNAGVADSVESLLLAAGSWTAAESSEVKREGSPVWGVDLGTTAAMSAVSAFWPDSGRLEVLAAFPSEPSLAERGIRDGVGGLYRECAEAGELLRLGGSVVDVPALIAAAWERFGSPVAVAADRWRIGELRDALEAAAVPLAALAARGMGFRDGAEDVRAFRRAILDGKARPVPSRLLRSAMAEARVVSDPAGNAKLAKGTQGGRRANARDDAAAAAILAVAEGSRFAAAGASAKRLRWAVVG